jgi:integrase
MNTLLNRMNRDIPYEKYKQFLIIKTLANTGLRVSELVRMKTTDLLIPTAQIYVPAGKGKARSVDVDPDLLRDLTLYIRINKIRKRTRVFPLSRQQIGNITRKRTGLNPHAFRHSYAHALFEKTQNAKYVRNQLGHSDLKITEIYLEGMSFNREKAMLKDLFR